MNCFRYAAAILIGIIWTAITISVLRAEAEAQAKQREAQAIHRVDIPPRSNVQSTQSSGQETQAPENRSGNNKGETMNDTVLGYGANTIMAVFTVGIFFAAIVQACIYLLMHATAKTIERAWVSLESLEVLRGRDASDRTIVVGLRNSGRLPARILDANISLAGITEHNDVLEQVEELPPMPTYYPNDFAFPHLLVAGEVARWDFPVTHRVSGDVQNLSLLLAHPGDTRSVWIYGYVHYVDPLTPKTIRRYGWVRRYDNVRSQQTGSFVFRHVNNNAYNYAD